MKRVLLVIATASLILTMMLDVTGCGSGKTTSSMANWAGKYVATDNPQYYVELKGDGHYTWQTDSAEPERGTYAVSTDMGLLRTHHDNLQNKSPNQATKLTPFDGTTIYETVGGRVRKYVRQ